MVGLATARAALHTGRPLQAREEQVALLQEPANAKNKGSRESKLHADQREPAHLNAVRPELHTDLQQRAYLQIPLANSILSGF